MFSSSQSVSVNDDQTEISQRGHSFVNEQQPEQQFFVAPSLLANKDLIRKSTKDKVMVVNAALLTPDFKGGDNRMLTVIRSLQQAGYDVTYVHYCFEDGLPRHYDYLINMGVEVWGPITASFQFHKSKLERLNYIAAFEWLWTNGQYFEFLQIFNNIISTYSPRTAIITVSDDVIYKRLDLEILSNDVNKDTLVHSYRAMELYFWSRADVVTSINDDVKTQQHLSLMDGKATSVIRYCQPLLNHNLNTTTSINTFETRNGILFMGYNNEANRQAVKWLITEVHKKLYTVFKDAKIHIFGNVLTPDVSKICTVSNGCINHGPVSDAEVSTWITKVRWFVAPVFIDAGISTKILYALSCGTPVMTTARGLSGLIRLQDVHMPLLVVENDNIQTFPTVLIEYYMNKAYWISKQALAINYVKDNFGCHLVTMDVIDTLKQASLAVSRRGVNIHGLSNRHKVLKRPIKVLWEYSDDVKLSFSVIGNLVRSMYEYHRDSVVSLGSKGCEGYVGNRSVDVFVRFQWPPDFARPVCCPVSTCRFVVYQPWEMGYIPKYWTPYFEDVDAVWVPSSYTAEMFTARGAIPVDKVSVVPHGVHCNTLNTTLLLPSNTNTPPSLRTKLKIPSSTIVFMYIGAIIPRKGIDILLDSWCDAFPSASQKKKNKKDVNVALIIKASYSHGGEELIASIKKKSKSSSCARIYHVSAWDEDLASVYKAADVLVHPTRAEGFGLTPLEALAAGNVVIAPDKGATNDFLSKYYASLVKSNIERCKVFPCKDDKFCVFREDNNKNSWNKCEQLEDHPVWHPMSREGLKKTLIDVSRHFKRHKEISSFGRKFVCEHFSWTAASDIAVHEIRKVWSARAKQKHQLQHTHVVRSNSSRWQADASFDKALRFFYEYYKFSPIFT